MLDLDLSFNWLINFFFFFAFRPKNQSKGDKEIFMYDVSTQAVSKLSGDLSSAFVDAAESNSESPESIDDSSFTS